MKKITRNIHDSGAKHKENVERFLREQNQRGREKEADTARMNKQMEAIEKAALEQYQQDIKAGLAQPSSSSPAQTKVQATPTASSGLGKAEPGQPGAVASPKRADTSSAAGTVVKKPKPSSEQEALESGSKPTIIRDETVGQPGEWQTVEAPMPPKRGQDDKIPKKDESGSHYVPGAEDDDGDADPEDLRSFKIEEKTYPVDSTLPDENGDNGDDSGVAVFKKRKAGASKPRNIRRKL
ncbi:hypothetical protein BGX34_010525 [Mortierella sp. NVP85]|nr:hypothetical protein BGX34_010525 [Mortierella sp. NVP85]